MNEPAITHLSPVHTRSVTTLLTQLLRCVFGVACFFPLFVYATNDRSSINMPVGVTDISETSYDLHMLVIYLCVVIAIIVFSTLFWSLFKYRRSAHPTPATFSHNNTIEVIWTVIPTIILIALAFPAIQALQVRYDTSKADVDIKVTGHQWKWGYDYLNEDINFYSNLSTPRAEIENKEPKGEHYLLQVDNEMVVPVDKKVRLLVTAADVLHSWWVPDFAVKQDAIPGYINEAWFRAKETGVYRGQCAELCGKDHGFMPVVVRVVEQKEYDAWVAKKQANAKATAQQAAEQAGKSWATEDLVAMGGEVYAKNCLACHQAQGQGLPPSFPALAGNALVVDADATEVIKAIVQGRKGTAMAAYGPQLSQAEIAAVITYIRNSFGNEAPAVLPKNIVK